MYEIKLILEAIKEGHVNPGEVVIYTGLPRYEVLALFHVLEDLGLIETIYSKGSHKVYRLTPKGEEILEALEKGMQIELNVKKETSLT
ncbi:winged helix-turn-helix domain-containing protein [Sulfurisphaera javensis]